MSELNENQQRMTPKLQLKGKEKRRSIQDSRQHTRSNLNLIMRENWWNQPGKTAEKCDACDPEDLHMYTFTLFLMKIVGKRWRT